MTKDKINLSITDIWEKIISLKEKDAFWWGVWIIIAILFFVQGGNISLNTPSFTDYWACAISTPDCQTYGLGSPSWQDWEYKIIINSINPTGDCLKADIFRTNGQNSTGFYCVGDEIIVGNLLVKIDEIKPSLSKPVHITYKNRIDASGLFLVLILGIPMWLLYRKYQKQKEYQEMMKRSKREEEIRKKLKRAGIDMNEFREWVKDQMEEEEE